MICFICRQSIRKWDIICRIKREPILAIKGRMSENGCNMPYSSFERTF